MAIKILFDATSTRLVTNKLISDLKFLFLIVMLSLITACGSDGGIDDADNFITYYQDGDSDGYGNPNVTLDATSQPTGYVLDNTDCDDSSAAVNPGAIEITDGFDNNCDGQVDENTFVTAPVNLNGIWEGTMTDKDTSDIYDVDMVLYMPEGVTEGHLLAFVSSQETGEPEILIEAGYDMEPNVAYGFDYYAGTTSSQGTFVKNFQFDDKLVGSNKGGHIGLNLSENTLTGEVQLDGVDTKWEFDIVLEYSLQNLNDTAMVDLEGTWSDANNGWDDLADGVIFTVHPDGTVSAISTGGSSCEGSGLAVDISNYNIYNFDFDLSAPGITGVTLSNCDTRLVNTSLGDVEVPVDGDYSGMAVLVEDDTGNSILKLILTSQKLEPAVATYNEFIKN